MTFDRQDVGTTGEVHEGAVDAAMGAPVVVDGGGSGRCTRVADSSVSRYGSTGTVLTDGRVLLVGSTTHDASGPYSPVVEQFDPSTHAITRLAPLHVGRAKHAAVRLADGRVLIVGGMSDESSTGFSRSAEVYDPSANRWTKVASIPEGAIGQALMTLADGRVLLAGGDVMYKARKLSQVLEFDPKAMRWSPWPDAPVPRAGTLEPLADGRVLFTGDSSTWSGEQSPSVDILDPKTRSWSSVRPIEGATVTQAVRVRANQLALFAREEDGGVMRPRVALVDDSLSHARELPTPPDPSDAAWASGISVDGLLYVAAKPDLLRWDEPCHAWVKVATFAADDCSTSVSLPGSGGGRGRLLFVGRCGIPEPRDVGAIEVCDL